MKVKVMMMKLRRHSHNFRHSQRRRHSHNYGSIVAAPPQEAALQKMMKVKMKMKLKPLAES